MYFQLNYKIDAVWLYYDEFTLQICALSVYIYTYTYVCIKEENVGTVDECLTKSPGTIIKWIRAHFDRILMSETN